MPPPRCRHQRGRRRCRGALGASGRARRPQCRRLCSVPRSAPRCCCREGVGWRHGLQPPAAGTTGTPRAASERPAPAALPQDSCPTGAPRGRAASLASERGPCAGTGFRQELQHCPFQPSQLQGPPVSLCCAFLRETQTGCSPVGAPRGSRAVPQGGRMAGCSGAPSSAPSQQEPQDPAASCSACTHAVPCQEGSVVGLSPT